MAGNSEIEYTEAGEYSTECMTNMRGRSQRRDALLRMITKNGLTVPKDLLLGVFMMREHAGLSLAYEYLKELKMARLVVESGGHILTMEQYAEEQAEDAKRLKELTN